MTEIRHEPDPAAIPHFQLASLDPHDLARRGLARTKWRVPALAPPQPEDVLSKIGQRAERLADPLATLDKSPIDGAVDFGVQIHATIDFEFNADTP